MTILFCDGFDHYASADFTKKWTTVGAACTINTSVPPHGGGCFATGGSGSILQKSFAAQGVVCVGLRQNFNGSFGSVPFLQIMDGSTIQVSFNMLTDGTIQAKRNNTTLLGASAAGVINSSAWNYIECKVTVHNTAGTVDVWVNGVSVISISGQNTRQSVNNQATIVQIGPLANGTYYYDDFYITDGSNLGDIRIDTYMPNGDGTYSQFTPSTGTTHYTLVDEATPNTTDYNSGVNVGDKDTYAFTDVGASTGTVVGCAINIAASKSDAGTRSIAPYVKSGATEQAGTTSALSTTQLYYQQTYLTNPNGGGSWTSSTVNAAEFGAQVAA